MSVRSMYSSVYHAYCWASGGKTVKRTWTSIDRVDGEWLSGEPDGLVFSSVASVQGSVRIHKWTFPLEAMSCPPKARAQRHSARRHPRWRLRLFDGFWNEHEHCEFIRPSLRMQNVKKGSGGTFRMHLTAARGIQVGWRPHADLTSVLYNRRENRHWLTSCGYKEREQAASSETVRSTLVREGTARESKQM